MDFDLTEYDQVEEVKLVVEAHNQLYSDSSPSRFMVTLSSSLDQYSSDEINCENDYVFLPAPSKVQTQPLACNQQSNNQTLDKPTTSRATTSSSQGSNAQQQQPSANRSHVLPQHRSQGGLGKTGVQVASRVIGDPSIDSPIAMIIDSTQQSHPLTTISSNRVAEAQRGAKNPFGGLSIEGQAREATSMGQRLQQLGIGTRQFTLDSCSYDFKPIGLLDLASATTTNPNKLADLMQQVVSKSDSIHIKIPCAFCNQLIPCPPSNLTGWLNHMFAAHHCRVCPICNRMIGLGPQLDLDIMKRHVVGHFDDDWLAEKPTKVGFTYGLQQKWFSGNKCTISDAINK